MQNKINLREYLGYYISNPRYKNGRWGSLVWNENIFLSKVKFKGNGYSFSEGNTVYKFAGGIITFSTGVSDILRRAFENESEGIKTNVNYKKDLETYYSNNQELEERDEYYVNTLSPREKKFSKQLFTGFPIEFQIYIKCKFSSLLNNIYKNHKIKFIFSKFTKERQFSLGNYFNGRFLDRANGQSMNVFEEISLSIEIVGIPFILLQVIAAELCREFSQISVLVRDNHSEKILLIHPDSAEYSLKSIAKIMEDLVNTYKFHSIKIIHFIYEFLYIGVSDKKFSIEITKDSFNRLYEYINNIYSKVKEIPLETDDKFILDDDVLRIMEGLDYKENIENFKEDLSHLVTIDLYDLFEVHYSDKL
jgi:hypothetical protein